MEMPDLKLYYRQMWDDAMTAYAASEFAIDEHLDSEDDKRYGLILVARPSSEVYEAMNSLFQELKAIEPEQYYYPSTDLHFTIIAIISCRQGFTMNALNVQDYIALVTEALTDVRAFSITCKGLTAFPGGVLMQGFPSGDSLQLIRNKLRIIFQRSDLEHTIDIRYKIQTSHCTLIRYRKPLMSKTKFIDVLQRFREKHWGTTLIQPIELVYSDWYQRKKNTEMITVYDLK